MHLTSSWLRCSRGDGPPWYWCIQCEMPVRSSHDCTHDVGHVRHQHTHATRKWGRIRNGLLGRISFAQEGVVWSAALNGLLFICCDWCYCPLMELFIHSSYRWGVVWTATLGEHQSLRASVHLASWWKQHYSYDIQFPTHREWRGLCTPVHRMGLDPLCSFVILNDTFCILTHEHSDPLCSCLWQCISSCHKVSYVEGAPCHGSISPYSWHEAGFATDCETQAHARTACGEECFWYSYSTLWCVCDQ